MKKYRISRNNKTYAQMGAQQPSQEEMMMMQQQQGAPEQGAQQSAPQQDPQKQVMQLAQQVSAVLQKGQDARTIAQELLQTKIPPQAIGQAFEMLVQQGVVDESEMQAVAQILMASEGEQQQAQPSEEEMMAMQQQQAASQQPPMARAGYIKKGMKARAGMSVDQEAGFASATNLIADKNMQKNNLLRFTQDNVAANQFGQEYDQMYAGGSLEQARYGRGKARRAARRAGRGGNDNWQKNSGRRARQLARRAVKEMPDVYSKADRRALREGLASGEFDKYDVYRGEDVFNPQSKPGYPEVDAGSWNSTMIPGRNWGAQTSVEEVTSPDEMVEETSTESNVITDFDNSYDYKNENGVIYTRKKGSSDWIKVDPESNAGRAIRKKVYGEDDVTFDEGPDYIDADATGETITPIDDNPEPDNPNMLKALDGEWYDTTDMPEDAYQKLFDPDFYDPNNTEIDDSDGNVTNEMGNFDPYDPDNNDMDYGTWLRDLPYDDDGYAYDYEGGMYDINDYNRNFNRSGLNNPFDNDDAHNLAIDFRNMGYAGYSGDGIRRGNQQGNPVPKGGYMDPGDIPVTTQPVYYDENGESIGGEPGMQFGGQYSNDGLEMARFGRGRARRQARRAGRQARRAGRQAGRGLGQMNRAMRGAYGNIAFPSGASPMMAGMPMMGPNGAGANMMQFHGRRGLLGGLREFSMNMPANFGAGMFMNGMYNPYGMQSGYNDMRYKITYPGESSEVEEVEQKEQKKATNDVIADDANGGGGTGGSGSDWDCDPCEDGHTPGKDPAGDCMPCKEAEEDCTKTTEDCVKENGEGYELGIGCKCKRTGDDDDTGGGTASSKCEEAEAITVNSMPVEGRNEFCAKKFAAQSEENGMEYIWDPNECQCSPISSGSLLTWTNAGIAVVAVGGYLYLKKSGKLKKLKTATSSRLSKIHNKIKSLYTKGTTKAAAEADALIKKYNIKLLDAGTDFFVGNKPRGVNPRFNTNYRTPSITGSGTTPPPANTAGASTTAERKAVKQLSGTPAPKQIGPVRKNITSGARKITKAERAFLMQEVQNMSAMSIKQARALARRYGVKAIKGRNAKQLQKAVFKIIRSMQRGGSVDPNLYMFTGGGAPDYVDYFGDGGYYEDGGFPQYENVYDPYMPMAENGMVANAGQYPMTELDYYKSQQFRDDANASILNNQRAFYPTPTGFSPSGTVGKYSRRPMSKMQNPGPGAQYGGYQEGDVVDMTQAQLGAFLRAGGQVEFVD